MDITVNLTAVVLLLAANGFFVAAEFALVKARAKYDDIASTLCNENSDLGAF